MFICKCEAGEHNNNNNSSSWSVKCTSPKYVPHNSQSGNQFKANWPKPRLKLNTAKNSPRYIHTKSADRLWSSVK